MGFSFTLTTGAGNLAAGPHEYYIGTSPTPNSAPTANAGKDQIVASTATVTLDGTGSSGVAAPFTYQWSQVDTSENPVNIIDPTDAQPTFTAPTLGKKATPVILDFSLVVTDAMNTYMSVVRVFGTISGLN